MLIARCVTRFSRKLYLERLASTGTISLHTSLMPPPQTTSKVSAAERICDFLILASNPLRCIGPHQFPIGIASCALVDYGGERWVLTVAHATGDGKGNWAIEMGFEEGRGAKLWSIGPMTFMDQVTFTKGSSVQLDLAYARVPRDLQPILEYRDENEQLIRTAPRRILKSNLRTAPTKRKIYGFAGNIKPTSGPPVTMNWLLTELVCYPTLKFVGEFDHYYQFKLPFSHPGHEEFKGTSGSPICDRQGNVVALVCGPGKEPDTIAGIKMSYFRSALDVELQQIAADCSAEAP